MSILRNLKYKWSWLNILFSPFVLPRVFFYLGKIEKGTPYFLPRRWKKISEERAIKKTQEFFDKQRKVHEDVGRDYKAPTQEQMDDKLKSFKKYLEAVPKKWGWDIVPLGWKTKFDSYRHEWNPMISVVGFNRQLCIYFGLNESMENMCYWEAWLTYKHETNKDDSVEDRLKALMKIYSASWGTPKKGYTNYYHNILKNKYKHLIKTT